MAAAIPRSDTHVVLLRRSADDSERTTEPRWEGVGFASSLARARSLALRSKGVGWGDVLLALPIEGINPLTIHGEARDLYVVRKSSAVVRCAWNSRKMSAWLMQEILKLDPTTALDLWEGNAARADMMLDWAWTYKVDPRRIVAAMISMVCPLLDHNSDKRLILALELAEQWCRSGVRSRLLEESAAQASDASMGGFSRNSLIAEAVSVVAWTAAGSAGPADADKEVSVCNAALTVSQAMSWFGDVHHDQEACLRELSAVVRTVIPIHVLLLAGLGEQYPYTPPPGKIS